MYYKHQTPKAEDDNNWKLKIKHNSIQPAPTVPSKKMWFTPRWHLQFSRTPLALIHGKQVKDWETFETHKTRKVETKLVSIIQKGPRTRDYD